jgi:tRNA threonylcarbamoyl adenosine modification protein YjeE
VTSAEGISSRSAGATEASGRDLATRLRAGDVVLLEGDLAAGKTTFVRGLVDGLGGSADAVSSPTFVLLQSYDCTSDDITVVHHVDLYRLAENVEDLREIGLDETLSDSTLSRRGSPPMHGPGASRSPRWMTTPAASRSRYPNPDTRCWMLDAGCAKTINPAADSSMGGRVDIRNSKSEIRNLGNEWVGGSSIQHRASSIGWVGGISPPSSRRRRA